MSAERGRVAGLGKAEDELRQSGNWYRWGPHLSERQWGTVREDCGAGGNAWDFPLDHAWSLAYRWGKDVKAYWWYLDAVRSLAGAPTPVVAGSGGPAVTVDHPFVVAPNLFEDGTR